MIPAIQDPHVRAELRRIRTKLDSFEKQIAVRTRNNVLLVQHSELEGLGFSDSGHTGFVPASRQIIGGTGITVSPGSLGADNTISLSAAGNGQRRAFLPYGRNTAMGADNYLNYAAMLCSATRGAPVPRACSVIGIAGMIDFTVFANNTTITFDIVKVGGSSLFTCQVAATGVGVWTARATQAAGIDTLLDTDIVTAYVSGTNWTGNTAGVAAITVEVELDT